MADHNLIVHENLPAAKPFSAFPALRWDPETGEARQFDNEGDVPEGWLSYHPNDEAAAAAAGAKVEKTEVVEVLPLSREEIIAALTAGKISFKKNAKDKTLYELLLTSVKAALTEAKIEHDAASTDAKALLELFPKE